MALIGHGGLQAWPAEFDEIREIIVTFTEMIKNRDRNGVDQAVFDGDGRVVHAPAAQKAVMAEDAALAEAIEERAGAAVDLDGAAAHVLQ